MRELGKFYESIDSPAKPVIERFGGSADMARRFVLKFTEDGCFDSLTEALGNNEEEEAFRAAHTLKGISASLGFEKLLGISSQITEILRGGDMDGAKAAYPELKAEYSKVLDAAKTLRD